MIKCSIYNFQEEVNYEKNDCTTNLSNSCSINGNVVRKKH